ncbi:hypothetical protein GGTG_12209 [Gaeumannomyces tritici R3-111a-1]|uniref:Uncharacterized protein n=1 Tax=Gaeumannomyces tritici (strain R3-111a-1) TaxID=644352 RepID=J3PFD2_GAET3|nr:hypothetical protein GGTG_12209 [Gaeumannomyces tritici R3-111a-1]EJT70034.1 hypothetical protein GGTG_12209 [Gaeumannomyces tritici R3-111a-1]
MDQTLDFNALRFRVVAVGWQGKSEGRLGLKVADSWREHWRGLALVKEEQAGTMWISITTGSHLQPPATTCKRGAGAPYFPFFAWGSGRRVPAPTADLEAPSAAPSAALAPRAIPPARADISKLFRASLLDALTGWRAPSPMETDGSHSMPCTDAGCFRHILARSLARRAAPDASVSAHNTRHAVRGSQLAVLCFTESLPLPGAIRPRIHSPPCPFFPQPGDRGPTPWAVSRLGGSWWTCRCGDEISDMRVHDVRRSIAGVPLTQACVPAWDPGPVVLSPACPAHTTLPSTLEQRWPSRAWGGDFMRMAPS